MTNALRVVEALLSPELCQLVRLVAGDTAWQGTAEYVYIDLDDVSWVVTQGRRQHCWIMAANFRDLVRGGQWRNTGIPVDETEWTTS